MPTYLVWDREVLEECYDQVDAISLHNYYGNTAALTGNDSSRYLAMNLDMERQIQEIAAVCDYVQAVQRSPKRLWLSFDEWNVWYRARGGRFANGQRTFAPRLLEEEYNLEDALLVGGFLNTLLRQAERVRVGCLAQIVNVIAPLVTNETSVLRQTHLLPVRVGAQVRAREGPRAARWSPRPTRSRPRASGRTSPATSSSPTSTSPPPSTPRTARCAC